MNPVHCRKKSTTPQLETDLEEEGGDWHRRPDQRKEEEKKEKKKKGERETTKPSELETQSHPSAQPEST
jgi:hypothetical protein